MPRATVSRQYDVAYADADEYIPLHLLWSGFQRGFPVPPPIIDFAEHPSLLNTIPLYPRQKTLLKLIYLEKESLTDYDYDVIGEWSSNFYHGNERVGIVPDVLDRVDYLKARKYDHFREVIFIGGRRGGKGHIGAIIGARQIWWMLNCTPSPQIAYGIAPNKEIYSFVTATSFVQAKDIMFADLYNVCVEAPVFEKNLAYARNYKMSFRTSADVKRIRNDFERGVYLDREVASIVAQALTSNSKAGRGHASFLQIYDEFAHMVFSTTGGPRTGEEVYTALTPSMDQMARIIGEHRVPDYMSYIPSSPYCLVPETRVLTDDLRWVPVGSLSVGDGLWGFDEFKKEGNGRRWRRATVTETSLIQAPTYEVKTTGPAVVATGDHMWLTRRRYSGTQNGGHPWYETRLRWVKTKDLRPGDRIGDIGTWEVDETRGAGYLAGFFDGEGHIPSHKLQGLYAGACQNPGPVLDSVLRLLDERELTYWTHRKRKTDDTVSIGINGGLAMNMKFMGSIRPERLLPKFLERLEGQRTYGRLSKAVEVLSVEEVGVQDVVALGTSTNTLMAEGMFSHNTKVGGAYDLYVDGLATNQDGTPAHPDVLVIQLMSWDPYKDWQDPLATEPHRFVSAPAAFDETMVRLERKNPDSFKVERRAQWAETINAYLNPELVDRIFEPFLGPDGKERILRPTSEGIFAHVYRGHADPSFSNHNFALCIGHTERIPHPETGEEWSHVIWDLLHVWRPEDFDDHIIPYDLIQDELVQVIKRFPTLEVFSYDQYGGFATVPLMKRELRKAGHRGRVREVTHTPGSKFEKWERFKTAVNLGWVHGYRDSFGDDGRSLLELELKFLQVKNGRVVKQDIGPVVTDDLADASAQVASELLADQIDRLERRENLAAARVLSGAPGGYHSGTLPEEGFPGPTARDKLRQHSERAVLGDRGRDGYPTRGRRGF